MTAERAPVQETIEEVYRILKRLYPAW